MATMTNRETELQARLHALTVSTEVMSWKSAHHGFVALCLIVVHLGLMAFGFKLVAWAVGAFALLEALRSLKWGWRAFAGTVRRIFRCKAA